MSIPTEGCPWTHTGFSFTLLDWKLWPRPMAKRPLFQFHRPQQTAAILLLLLLVECLWVVANEARTETAPQRFAAAYSLSNTSGRSTIVEHVMALPLAAAELVSGQSPAGPLSHPVIFSLAASSGFIFFGLALGAAIWWVTRRLYGNTGGFIALALYCFSPPVIRASTRPNREILTAFGLFAVIYTAMGVAHALHGPKSKWRPRIVLFTLSLGITAAAGFSAFLLGALLSIALLAYLAPDRRAAFLPVLSISIPGALLLGFASSGFELGAFLGSVAGGERLSLTSVGLDPWFALLPNAALTIAAVIALAFYIASRRSRYFGNTLPLLLFAGLFLLAIPADGLGTRLWALPFLFVFIAGIFADMLETEARRVFSWAAGSVVALEIAMAAVSLPGAPSAAALTHAPRLNPASVPAAVEPIAEPGVKPPSSSAAKTPIY